MLALLSLLAASAFAQTVSVPAASFEPVLAAVESQPLFRQELLNQLELLPILQSPSDPALPELPRTDVFDAKTPAFAYKIEAARLARVLAARPELLEAHRERLERALGPQALRNLEAAARSVEQTGAARPTAGVNFEVRAVRKELEEGGASSPEAVLGRLAKIFDQEPPRDPARDAFFLNLQAARQGSAYAFMNLARHFDEGDGVARDAVQAHRWLSLAAKSLPGEAKVQFLHRDLERRMKPEQVDVAKKLAAAMGLAEKPRLYLAGPWGFDDFNVKKEAYGAYPEKVAGVPFRPGFELLKLIGADAAKLGWTTLNPWTDTFPELLIAGPMFGAGAGLDGRPWSEGSLAAGTLSKESLLHWIEVAQRDYRVSPKEYRPTGAPPYSALDADRLEQIYRGMVGDMIYRGNKAHVESSDVVFANLNAYRGDADDGTLWELIHALQSGKEAVVLVDAAPEKSLNEGLFGREVRWNIMVSGYLKEHQDRVKVFHRVDDALAYLARRVSGKRRP